MLVLDLHALIVHEKQSFNPLVVISDIFATILYYYTPFFVNAGRVKTIRNPIYRLSA